LHGFGRAKVCRNGPISADRSEWAARREDRHVRGRLGDEPRWRLGTKGLERRANPGERHGQFLEIDQQGWAGTGHRAVISGSSTLGARSRVALDAVVGSGSGNAARISAAISVTGRSSVFTWTAKAGEARASAQRSTC